MCSSEGGESLRFAFEEYIVKCTTHTERRQPTSKGIYVAWRRSVLNQNRLPHAVRSSTKSVSQVLAVDRRLWKELLLRLVSNLSPLLVRRLPEVSLSLFVFALK